MSEYTPKSEQYEIIEEAYQFWDLQMVMIIPPTMRAPIDHVSVIVEPCIEAR